MSGHASRSIPFVFNTVNYLGVNTTWGMTLEPRETFGRSSRPRIRVSSSSG